MLQAGCSQTFIVFSALMSTWDGDAFGHISDIFWTRCSQKNRFTFTVTKISQRLGSTDSYWMGCVLCYRYISFKNLIICNDASKDQLTTFIPHTIHVFRKPTSVITNNHRTQQHNTMGKKGVRVKESYLLHHLNWETAVKYYKWKQ